MNINSNLKFFINGESDLIQNEEWEKLIKKFSVHSLNNNEVKEFYSIMENSGIYIPLEIKEMSLINKINDIFAKFRGNKKLYYILDMIKADQGYDVKELLNSFMNHTYGFDEKEIKDILFKYKDKLIIPIEEIKL